MMSVSEDRVELQLREGQTVSIPLADVASARLAVDL
jgi:ribosome maturation factor RimP